MKSLAVAVALRPFSGSRCMRAPRTLATRRWPPTTHISRAAVVRNGGIYLLENDGAGSRNQVPNFQDNWDIGY
jgi:hypothetical protein